MLIRVGFELLYECPQLTPMVLMLNVHYTRSRDLVVPDHVITSPSIPIAAYRDGFGNWCSRIVAPRGQLRLSSVAVVRDTGEPDRLALSDHQHAVQDLPDECLMFLLGSRYCETDRLTDVAWELFGQSPSGARR